MANFAMACSSVHARKLSAPRARFCYYASMTMSVQAFTHKRGEAVLPTTAAVWHQCAWLRLICCSKQHASCIADMTDYTDTPLSITCADDSSSNLWQGMTDAVAGQLADSVTLMMSYAVALAPGALNIAEPVIRPRELGTAAAALSPPHGACPRLLDVFIASLRKGAQGRSARTTCVFNPTKLPKLTQSIL